MPIKKRFNKTIDALKSGHRYLIPLEKSEVEAITKSLNVDDKQLNECLCILQNTSSYLPEIAPQIISLLEQSQSPDLIIHLLNVSRRHIISAYQRDGQRLPSDFLLVLKKCLSSNNAEVVEWTVRTIDECGSQALYFKDELLRIYPGKISMMFNEHKRHTRGIIDLLLKKWRHMP